MRPRRRQKTYRKSRVEKIAGLVPFVTSCVNSICDSREALSNASHASHALAWTRHGAADQWNQSYESFSGRQDGYPAFVPIRHLLHTIFPAKRHAPIGWNSKKHFDEQMQCANLQRL